MDEKGYAFTPLAFLLIIPVVIIAVSYGNIVNELNSISQLAVGGDVVQSTGSSLVNAVQKTSQDAGRNAAFKATRQVIDNEANKVYNPFLSNSTDYIETLIVASLNNNIIETAKKLKNETGRDIYVNNILINDSTPSNASTITKNNVTIYQTDPYSFYVNVTGGIPVTVVQNGQNYTFQTPPVSSQVSIEGLEDPYIWIKSRNRLSVLFYKYPYYSQSGINANISEYHFDDSHNSTGLYHLNECLNGTGNAGNITPNPYYFPDIRGLTFFDRLEGRSNDTSLGPNSAKMSTFIIGNPLVEDHNYTVSALDHEYFSGIAGSGVTVSGLGNLKDPDNALFMLSTNYKGWLSIESSY
ncbi:MAG TPA: hypothetical protein VK426_11020 [Methanobacterium sp.]|nr:hypothetical protein [Methanobacterium sp.]